MKNVNWKKVLRIIVDVILVIAAGIGGSQLG